MRIAIVDDIAAEREVLHERINIQLARLSMYANIFEYKSGRDFLAAAREERFELVFLDIYMENENGMDTAKELRLFDSGCLLVFTTSSRDHALDGFRVRAMHYLVKPYTDEELEYSCAMKSHFRKSGNQMSGKWKSSYTSLLA